VQLTAQTEVIILQHPSEVKRAMGTARILALSLNRCHCLVGEDFSQREDLLSLLGDKNYVHALLYPSDDAEVVSESWLPLEEGKQRRVILLDGTWKKAYKMWQLAPMLHTLPCGRLPLDLSAGYRIRKPPTQNSLSTVEAGYHLLSILEPDRDFTPLLTSFEQMIEHQIQQMPEGLYEKHYGETKR
jgi:DTW domain-containing protein YfiP